MIGNNRINKEDHCYQPSLSIFSECSCRAIFIGFTNFSELQIPASWFKVTNQKIRHHNYTDIIIYDATHAYTKYLKHMLNVNVS